MSESAVSESEKDETASEPITRVVIAEDEAIIRMDLREVLEEEGYEVVGEAARGDEALELIRELRPDVAILDVKMPGLDGLSVAREVKNEAICAIVLLTAFSQKQLIAEAREAGVNGYLVKPFQRFDLTPAIEVAIGRFADFAEIQGKSDRLEDQLEVRKLVDRAKGLLIDNFGLTEGDAFNFLQKTAMDRRTPLKDVAGSVISGDLSPS